MTLNSLIREALKSCEWRGHQMKFVSRRDESDRRTVVVYACEFCGMATIVDTYPPPNGIDICGRAVALNCPSDRSKLRQK